MSDTFAIKYEKKTQTTNNKTELKYHIKLLRIVRGGNVINKLTKEESQIDAYSKGNNPFPFLLMALTLLLSFSSLINECTDGTL